jgi:hypothetical protein
MRGSNWQPLAALEPRRLREARLFAHFAAQWLARAARTYVAPKSDDSHTNLGWAPIRCRMARVSDCGCAISR